MTMIWTMMGVVLGAVAGSFLATLAIRWGRDESVAAGRSRCDNCAVTVPPYRLIPVVSFLLLRGRCAACGASIDPRQPLMEALCAAIGGIALAVRPDAAGLAGALLGWLLATLALLDFDHYWLPDALVAPLAAVGLCAGLADLDPPLVDRLIGGAAGYLAFAAVAAAYRRLRGRTGLGAGDAKLLGAIGCWLGYALLPWVVLGAALLGLAGCLIALGRGRQVALTDRLPLGTLLAAAAWPLWLATQIM